MVLAFAVVVHLATIIYAVRGGLTAAEVLGRTRGNGWFLAFYALFVVAVAVHAPIGVRNILREWTRWPRRRRRSDGVRRSRCCCCRSACGPWSRCTWHDARLARQPGFLAALLHRLSGIALAIFLPIHFLALGTALKGADSLDASSPPPANRSSRSAELGIVVALALHMALGLRVLAIEFLACASAPAVHVGACVAAASAIGLVFALNVQ